MLDIVIRWVGFQLCVEYAPNTVLILLFNRVVVRDLVKRGTIYIININAIHYLAASMHIIFRCGRRRRRDSRFFQDLVMIILDRPLGKILNLLLTTLAMT